MLQRLAVLCCLLTAAASPAAGNEPSFQEVTARIDAEVATRWQTAGVPVADTVDDAAYLRRVMLDLAGRVPTFTEWSEFVADPDPGKRLRLVESLLASPDFAWHLRNELDLLLLARRTSHKEWREYLLAAARDNRPWDQLFREIVLPEVHQPDQPGAAAFLRERVGELDNLTNDTAVLFFGVNIACAKCHDHPHVTDWKQDHYFGLASFFHRTYKSKQGLMGEKFDGRLSFKTVAGEEKPARFMFLTGLTVDEPPLERTDEERKALEAAVKQAQREDGAAPPHPEFSPRAELVRLALDDNEQHFLARNIVNRVWARLLGRGLVEPLDQMHSANPPSHPELLDWLARDLEQHAYDLQRLIGGIVLSAAYARSSRGPSEDRPPPELFAVAQPRALTPRQLALSLEIATLAPEASPGLAKPADWHQRREDLENRSSQLAGQLAIPDEGFQVSVEEALLFSNNDQVAREYLSDAGDRLLGALAKTADSAERVQQIYRAVLSRSPNDEEQARIVEYVSIRGDREAEAWRHVLWALLTSPEFRFNH